MITRRLTRLIGELLAVTLLTGLLTTGSNVRAQGGKPQPEKIPEKVMSTLKAKFPKAKIQKWAREKEDDVVVYDFEFTQNSRKFEADIREDGTILNWEEAISPKALPKAVRKTVDTKYPKATIKEAMRISTVKNKKSTLEGYEIVLVTADKKEVEITVAPNGKIIETGEEKTQK
ncbi:MAG: PepSY-like domain-containing protein [Armatimonadota bacterium]